MSPAAPAWKYPRSSGFDAGITFAGLVPKTAWFMMFPSMI
jgi:hypothetical protein